MGRAVAFLLVCALPAAAAAQGTALDSIEAVHEACTDARELEGQRLFVLEVEEGWRFAGYRDGALRIDTGRNFRALDGHVSVLVPREEHLGFELSEEDAARVRGSDARLRVGFFLGFDDSTRQPCLVRSRFAVTIVRADVAWIELVDASGARVARGETDRLRAWNDDREALAIAGQGPRGAIEAARFTNGTAPPETWQGALESAGTREGIARCHTEGVARGAAREGRVVVRLNVETRTGRVRRADVALSSLGDAEEAECIARALGASSTLPPGPTSWQAEVVDLAVPVRLVVD